MFIRNYKSSDCEQLAVLFYQTVHTVNAADYSAKQLYAWAPGTVDLSEWNASFLRHKTLVAIQDGIIAGFGDIDETGYLDRLFVHRDYQGQGIASALCDELENGFAQVITQASITAKSFFLDRGYKMIRKQQVEKNGILLTNYVMQK